MLMPVTRAGAGQSPALRLGKPETPAASAGRRGLTSELPPKIADASPAVRCSVRQARMGSPQLLEGVPKWSQRAQSSSSTGRCLANIVAGRWLLGRPRATPGTGIVLIWEPEDAGSNPAIPTGQSHF